MGNDGKHLSPYHFAPGTTGNPLGRPPVAPEAQGLRKFDKDSFGRLCWDSLAMTDEKIKEVVKDPDAPQIKKFLASIILKGRRHGDYHALDWLAVRSGLAPINQKVELTGENGTPLQLDGTSLAQRQELILRILERSRLIDDPQVKEILRRRLLASVPDPVKD